MKLLYTQERAHGDNIPNCSGLRKAVTEQLLRYAAGSVKDPQLGGCGLGPPEPGLAGHLLQLVYTTAVAAGKELTLRQWIFKNK